MVNWYFLINIYKHLSNTITQMAWLILAKGTAISAPTMKHLAHEEYNNSTARYSI